MRSIWWGIPRRYVDRQDSESSDEEHNYRPGDAATSASRQVRRIAGGCHAIADRRWGCGGFWRFSARDVVHPQRTPLRPDPAECAIERREFVLHLLDAELQVGRLCAGFLAIRVGKRLGPQARLHVAVSDFLGRHRIERLLGPASVRGDTIELAEETHAVTSDHWRLGL